MKKLKKLLCAALTLGVLSACQGSPEANNQAKEAEAKKTSEVEKIEKTDSVKSEKKSLSKKAVKTSPEKSPAKTIVKVAPKKISVKTPKKTEVKTPVKVAKDPIASTIRKALSKEEIKSLASDSGKADLKDFKAKYSYWLGYNLGRNIKNAMLDPNGLKGFDNVAFFTGYSDVISGKKPTYKKTAKNYKEIGADAKKNSYTIGYSMGENHLRSEIDLNVKAYAKGSLVSQAGKKPQLSNTEMEKVYEKFKLIQEAKDKKKILLNTVAGKKYLSENKNKKGVVTTASGLQYKVIKAGTGKHPKSDDLVKVHYKGTTIDGKEFDSSYARKEPAIFPLNSVIRGWTEGIQLMKVGAKYEFTIPSELAYGKDGTPNILPQSTLIFTVEFLSIEKKPEAPKIDKSKLKFTTTKSGLKYAVIEKGTGKIPAATDTVEVHYEGKLDNGKVFDSSYKRGKSISFPLNRVIKGWTEGLQLMKEGATYIFIIPSNLGYGARPSGPIPANSTLTFIVKLIKVK